MNIRGWRLANALAVPGTGRRGAYSNFLRHPRNASIKRAIVAAFDTLRGIDVPPNAWDDIPRSRERNWKRQRRTQWHEATQ